MRFSKAARRTAVLVAAPALALTVASGAASADPNPNNHGSAPQWIQLVTGDHVGVYNSANAGSSKFDNITLAPGDWVYADCWVAGGNVGSAGDVWYRTEVVSQSGQSIGVGVTWTFAPYVDYAAQFHNVPGLPAC